MPLLKKAPGPVFDGHLTYFTVAQANEFRRLVAASFADVGREVDVYPDRIEDRGGTTIGLWNIGALCAGTDEREWPQLIDDHVRLVATPARELSDVTEAELTFQGGKVSGDPYELEFKLDATKDPREIDFTILKSPNEGEKGKEVPGVYKLEGGKLTVHISYPGGPRPTETRPFSLLRARRTQTGPDPRASSPRRHPAALARRTYAT